MARVLKPWGCSNAWHSILIEGLCRSRLYLTKLFDRCLRAMRVPIVVNSFSQKRLSIIIGLLQDLDVERVGYYALSLLLYPVN